MKIRNKPLFVTGLVLIAAAIVSIFLIQTYALPGLLGIVGVVLLAGGLKGFDRDTLLRISGGALLMVIGILMTIGQIEDGATAAMVISGIPIPWVVVSVIAALAGLILILSAFFELN